MKLRYKMRKSLTLLFLILSVCASSCNRPGSLSKEAAEQLRQTVIADWKQANAGSMQENLDRLCVTDANGHSMKFLVDCYGDEPEGGHSLWISLHGGGGTTAEMNDGQWANQQKMYRRAEPPQPVEGYYISPRSIEDVWDMWFLWSNDDLFEQIIRTMVVLHGVNPDKVYLMGYSAGGDGVWRMAPRMADHWAAAAMMAGHPGSVNLMNVRNMPFTLWVGENDEAYNRNTLVPEKAKELDVLQAADPEGYIHSVTVAKDRPHWMYLEDSAAFPWMAQYTRNPYPKRVVWRQEAEENNRIRPAFYWVKAPENELGESAHGKCVIAQIDGNTIDIEKCDYGSLTIYLNDDLVDLDRKVKVTCGGKTLFNGKVPRTEENMIATMEERGDPSYVFCSQITVELTPRQSSSDLVFEELASSWDEAVPLGNAELGQLVWQKDGNLRFSLDHYDLWDLRPTEEFADSVRFSYKWIQERVADGDTQAIWDEFDKTYSDAPAPSKIACAALEFPMESLGAVKSVRLFINDALCRVEWESGATLETFVAASDHVGWFVFKGVDDPAFVPSIKAPQYHEKSDTDGYGIITRDLASLGYEQGDVSTTSRSIHYHQNGWGDYSYDVAVLWKHDGATLTGAWSVSTSLNDVNAVDEVRKAMKRGMAKDFRSHLAYWDGFWGASSVTVPDPVIQKQYDNEMYKLGSTSREDSRPISLQAVWTADNGLLPPWKGDYHNDLNTQLSYWPVYVGNHLAEGQAFLKYLWDCRDAFRQYARDFFGVEGIMVPGVATLDGISMGGWPQYSFSPTTAAWVAQHFYLHWKYSADDEFLKERAYPFMSEVTTALEQLSHIDSDGHRVLPLSTSPEIYDNSLKAWFHTMTNYDVSLMRFAFGAAAEMAQALGLDDDAACWNGCLAQMQPLDIQDDVLTFAKGFPYNESHRHFSHAMSIFPLELIDWSDGEESQKIIKATLARLDEIGPSLWCGYSYSWLANMKAHAMDGEGAAEALRIFAQCFCLPNTFHANGDQTQSGKSNFTYRPFTLEGNFAFASGLQQMLLQSHTGTIRVFPAIPSDWKDVSFSKLRARGAFLVSAVMEDGIVTSLEVYSEKGGRLSVEVPGMEEPFVTDTKAGETVKIIDK